MEKTYKNCQSCGMPMKKDPAGGGTNADGSKSAMYCSYCYTNGAFHNPDWTVQQMQAFCKQKLQEMGFPGFFAGLMVWNLPKLKRWKK
jgi:Putative zinc ribbon domain